MDYRIKPQGNPFAFFGRTIYDNEQCAMFFNWTAAGFVFSFEGTQASMETIAMCDYFPGEGENLPWVAVFVDDQPTPHSILKMQEGTHRYRLFECDRSEKHVIRVVKRSENSKGRVGLTALVLDGALLPYTAKEAPVKLEFIGDSITCGFGNDMSAGEPQFDAAKENGLTAYPAVTAGLLGADFHSICVSGIPLCWASDPDYRLVLPDHADFVPPVRAMESYYAYADRNHQECLGRTEGFTPWEFERFQPDAIIINLGTNDGFRLRVSGCEPKEEAFFIMRYQAFLHQLRRLNGAKPVIACTLGSMDYYLYDAIEKAVAAYQSETKDTNVFCMKFAPIDPWGEGFGGLGHPNTKTQTRMGHELADALKPWLGREASV